MGNDPKGVILSASEAGVTGEHAAAEPFAFLVGPTTTDEFNTARLRLIPIACFRVDDIRFAFDSSFVVASATSDPNDPTDNLAELRELARLVKAHPGSPLSVFGHADPVGNDDYNKLLSGRRAMAIYALLIVNGEPDSAVKLWQQVSATEAWGTNQRQTMQKFTGLPSGTADSTLFRSYMQKLCPPDLKLTKKDFLGQGADGGGKGDFQGCGEFNPVLIFSQEKQTEFDQAKQQNDKNIIEERNAENAPNRRVMVLMFRKGSKVDPTRWPCPRAAEGMADCKKRFWSDGEKRRSTLLPAEDRKFAATNDTFACRFYQRVSDGSPCEAIRETLVVWLLDDDGQRLPVGTPYRLSVGGQVRSNRLKMKGLIIETGLIPAPTATIEWEVWKSQEGKLDPKDQFVAKFVTKGFPDHPFLAGTTPIQAPPKGLFLFRAEIVLNTDHSIVGDEELVEVRLRNMGYPKLLKATDGLTIFQDDYELFREEGEKLKILLRDTHRDGTEMPLTQLPTPSPVPIPLDENRFPVKQCES
jgi:hypothetical protein